MYQAVEAVVKEGRIMPVEPIEIEENGRFLLIRLGPDELTGLSDIAKDAQSQKLSMLRASRGKFRGKLSSVDEFMARKEEEKRLT